MSELLAKSSPDAAAKSRSPGIASIVSAVVNPAAARFSIPSAACDAENDVSAPSSIACAFNFSNSSPVAPEIAFTRDICDSKSAPVLAAAVATPASAVAVPVIAAAATFNPFLATLLMRSTAPLILILDHSQCLYAEVDDIPDDRSISLHAFLNASLAFIPCFRYSAARVAA